MALAPGLRLGPYEVTSQIGGGGMGEVWRATDTRLKRQVAIKALPAAFVSDPDRVARFEREAEVLAALNHPNIAQIYGIEEASGITALVMELVEGETLADRIAHGPIPLDEALPLATQIAEALGAAHERGIIHRDLKPANINVRPDGTVKVLDFGLAKPLTPPMRTDSSLANSPTLTSPALVSGVGVLLGTAAYMSPEQVKGRPADKRSDLWAFGCVLYEMLTGRRAFGGEEVSEIAANILKAEPDWKALPSATPPTIRRLLARTLAKDPKARQSDAAGVRLDLIDAGQEADAIERTPATKRSVWLATTGLLGVAVGMLLGLAVARRGSPLTPPEFRVDITTPETSDSVSLSLSPDGSTLAFVAAQNGRSLLWVRRLDEGIARPLSKTEGATAPFWSPDGRAIGFFAESKVKRVDVKTGSVQAIADSRGGTGATWGTNDTIVFSTSASGTLARVSANGGPATPVTTLGTEEQGHRLPVFLHDDRHFLFFVRGSERVRGVYVGSLDGEVPRRVLGGDVVAPVFHVVDAGVFFVQQGVLMAQHFDEKSFTVLGRAVPIAEQVAVDTNGWAALSVSANGVIAYRSSAANNRRQFVWVDRTGKELEKVGEPDDSRAFSPQLSPSGRQVAIHRSINSNVDIWSFDLVTHLWNPLTRNPLSDINAQWSPDGTRIAFSRFVDGGFKLHILDVDSRKEENLGIDGTPQCWSPDGHTLLYHPRNRQDGGAAPGLWALSTADRKTSEVLPNAIKDAQFSPNGRWIAFMSNEAGRPEIYVARFGEAGTLRRVSDAGGGQPRWSPDGRELFYVAPDERMNAVALNAGKDGMTIEPGSPSPLFKTHLGGAVLDLSSALYMVSHDGKRFLMFTLLAEQSTPVHLILNWKADRFSDR